jgi:hypothetical protein
MVLLYTFVFWVGCCTAALVLHFRVGASMVRSKSGSGQW